MPRTNQPSPFGTSPCSVCSSFDSGTMSAKPAVTAAYLRSEPKHVGGELCAMPAWRGCDTGPKLADVRPPGFLHCRVEARDGAPGRPALGELDLEVPNSPLVPRDETQRS